MKQKMRPLIYFWIYVALLILLALTVGLSMLPLGERASTFSTLVIAVAKAWLVLVFFMKLRSVSPKIKFFAFASLVWTGILISLISADYLTRGLSGVLGK